MKKSIAILLAMLLSIGLFGTLMASAGTTEVEAFLSAKSAYEAKEAEYADFLIADEPDDVALFRFIAIELDTALTSLESALAALTPEEKLENNVDETYEAFMQFNRIIVDLSKMALFASDMDLLAEIELDNLQLSDKALVEEARAMYDSLGADYFDALLEELPEEDIDFLEEILDFLALCENKIAELEAAEESSSSEESSSEETSSEEQSSSETSSEEQSSSQTSSTQSSVSSSSSSENNSAGSNSANASNLSLSGNNSPNTASPLSVSLVVISLVSLAGIVALTAKRKLS